MATTGTGGDLFPGIAVAEWLVRDGKHPLLFVVSGIGPEEEALRRSGFSFERIRTGRLQGEGMLRKLRTLAGIPLSLARAARLLKRFGAEAVLGTGGYSSGPVVLAAWLMGIPAAVMEKNAIPGLTNRLLAPLARRIYTTSPRTGQFFPVRKTLWSGTPVREALSRVAPKAGGDFTVLVLGGSQGAAGLNRMMTEAWPLLRSAGKFRLIHQTGRGEFEKIRGRYESIGMEEVRVAPFIEEMAAAYQEADLVISRAGASTLAELVAVGRPALLLPYPFAANDHQRKNALGMAEAGAAEVISESEGAVLAGRIRHYEANRGELRKMAEAAARLPGRDAAKVVAEDLLRLGSSHV